MPWLGIRDILARQWGMAPWEIPRPDDRADPLSDEVGRWFEVEALKAKYGDLFAV